MENDAYTSGSAKAEEVDLLSGHSEFSGKTALDVRGYTMDFNSLGDITLLLSFLDNSYAIFKKDHTSSSFSLIAYYTSPSHAANGDYYFKVSPYNDNVMYIEDCSIAGCGNRTLMKSINSGASFSPISSYNHVDYGPWKNHVDLHAVELFDYSKLVYPESGLGKDPYGDYDRLFIGTDGGIDLVSSTYSSSLTFSIDNKNGRGLDLGRYYGSGITEQNARICRSGAQDGSYDNHQDDGMWVVSDDGDQGDFVIDPTDTSKYMGSANADLINKAGYTCGTSDIGGFILLPIALDNYNPDRFYFGGKQIYTLPIRSCSTQVQISSLVPDYYANQSRISSIAPASKSDTTQVYYSLSNHGASGDKSGGLFIAVKNSGSETWANYELSGGFHSLSTDPLLEAQINDIAVDPDNPKHVWVVFGNLSNGQKVYYCDRGATTPTWVNVSGCLPNVPVFTIAFQKNSGNRIYIGTDLGVYYLDGATASGTWKKYGGAQLNSTVYDLDINYCGNYLLASTFGRGIKKIPLKPSLPVALYSNTTWSTPQYFATDVVVTSGVTLTVSSTTISFSAGKRLIIDRNAKLVSTNSTFTNTCETMWQGIEVWGTKTQDQPTISSVINESTETPGSYPSSSGDQGVLILKGSTIENAITGIKLGTDVGSETNILDYDGGIVYASNSHFINNQRDVEFLQYSYKSISRFKKCNFTTANILKDTERPLKPHVTMWDVHSVQFINNTFENTASTSIYPTGSRGVGIHSEYADYKVKGFCDPYGIITCTSGDYSYFNDLDRGIEATGDGLESGIISINSVKMSGVSKGVFLSGLRNSVVTNNEIHEGSGILPYVFYGAYGVYVEGTDGQKVWDNHIVGFSTGPGYSLGIVSNSAAVVSANMTYHNLLEKTDIGFSGVNNNTKMQVKCNELDDNNYDIAVTSGDFPNQGKFVALSTDPDYFTGPAGNIFNHSMCNTSSPSTWNEAYLNSSLAPISYVHHTNVSRIPYCHSPNVSLIGSGASATGTGSNACQDLANTHVDLGTITTVGGAIIVVRKYFDNGHSPHRLGFIDTTTSNGNLMAIFDDTGIVSDEVIDNAMQRTDLLSDDDRFQILLKTKPESHYILANMLSHYDLKQWMKDSILTFVGDTSTRLNILDNLYQMQSIYDIMVNDYLGVQQDSGHLTQIIDFLQTDSSELGVSRLIDYKLMAGQESDVVSLMSSFNPRNPDLREGKIIQRIELWLHQTGSNFDSLGSSKIDTLVTLANSYSYAGIKARNILKHINHNQYDELIELPESYSLRKINPNTTTPETNPASNLVSIYPNPANQELFVKYNVVGNESVSIKIMDIIGKEVASNVVPFGSGNQRISTRDFASGVYIINVTNGGKCIFNDKFLVIH